MHWLHEVAALYHAQTLWLADTTGLPEQILHIHAGMIIFVATSLVAKQSLDRVFPLLMVIIMALGNECLDRINLGNWNWPDTKADLIYTITWPLVIWLAARVLKLIARPGFRFSEKSGDTSSASNLELSQPA